MAKYGAVKHNRAKSKRIAYSNAEQRGLKVGVTVDRTLSGGYEAQACILRGKATNGRGRCASSGSYMTGGHGFKSPTAAVKKALVNLSKRLK
jgi:hypothetical protein